MSHPSHRGPCGWARTVVPPACSWRRRRDWKVPVPAGSGAPRHSYVIRFLQRQRLTDVTVYLPQAKGAWTSSKRLGTVFRLQESWVPSGCWRWAQSCLPCSLPDSFPVSSAPGSFGKVELRSDQQCSAHWAEQVHLEHTSSACPQGQGAVLGTAQTPGAHISARSCPSSELGKSVFPP